MTDEFVIIDGDKSLALQLMEALKLISQLKKENAELKSKVVVIMPPSFDSYFGEEDGC